MLEDIADRGLGRNGFEGNVVGAGTGEVQQLQPWCERHISRPVHRDHGVRIGERTLEFLPVLVVRNFDGPSGLEKFRNEGESSVVVYAFDEYFQGGMSGHLTAIQCRCESEEEKFRL